MMLGMGGIGNSLHSRTPLLCTAVHVRVAMHLATRKLRLQSTATAVDANVSS